MAQVFAFLDLVALGLVYFGRLVSFDEESSL